VDFFNSILSFLETIWNHVAPFYIVTEYEGVIVLRNGKFRYQPSVGFHWRIPVIDEVIVCQIATETLTVKSQSLTTNDDKNIVISAVVKFNISEPRIYLLKVKDVPNAISDIAQGKIKSVVMNKSWNECRDPELDNEITKEVRKEAKKWGVNVEFVTITDLAIIRTIRLINS
jgi:regulator of protease activity HflC (stomatin/prohibitin superfamily)